jgi:hypothetical protein
VKTCTIAGCPKTHRARGLCVTHYNQRIQQNRHRKTDVPCGWCDKPCRKEPGRANRYEALYCSLRCRDLDHHHRGATCPVPTTHRTHPQYVPPLPVLRRRQPPTQPKQRAPRRFVAGTCHRCGASYLAQEYTDTARYCSLRCSRRMSKHRYRARKRAAYVEDVSPVRIFERDRWRCRLCNKRVHRHRVPPHPLAPVLDHVVPLAAGGTHEAANTQCAHFICNSVKGDRGHSEQLMLIG